MELVLFYLDLLTLNVDDEDEVDDVDEEEDEDYIFLSLN